VAPPLLLDRPGPARIVLAIVVPAVYGVITGVFLGISEVVYLVLSLLGVLGGIAAGYDHPDAGEGALRGFCGGALFGTFILLGGTVTGAEAKAHLPEPQWLLPVITTVLGILFGAIGGALRARHERSAAAAAPGVTRTSGP
jgi:uncharacterized membrane protein HdeD (DUF308 family)